MARAAPETPPHSKRSSVRKKHALQLFKTDFCKLFEQGMCKHGEWCAFAHNRSEVRRKPDLTRTSMCRVVLQGGVCRNPQCSFAHDKESLRTTTGFFKTRMCNYARSGKCRSGDACRFAHVPEELRTLAPRAPSEGAAPTHEGAEELPQSTCRGDGGARSGDSVSSRNSSATEVPTTAGSSSWRRPTSTSGSSSGHGGAPRVPHCGPGKVPAVAPPKGAAGGRREARGSTRDGNNAGMPLHQLSGKDRGPTWGRTDDERFQTDRTVAAAARALLTDSTTPSPEPRQQARGAGGAKSHHADMHKQSLQGGNWFFGEPNWRDHGPSGAAAGPTGMEDMGGCAQAPIAGYCQWSQEDMRAPYAIAAGAPMQPAWHMQMQGQQGDLDCAKFVGEASERAADGNGVPDCGQMLPGMECAYMIMPVEYMNSMNSGYVPVVVAEPAGGGGCAGDMVMGAGWAPRESFEAAAPNEVEQGPAVPYPTDQWTLAHCQDDEIYSD